MEATTAAPYTLKITLAGDTFDGTGREEVVREDYERFLEAKKMMLSFQPLNGKAHINGHIATNGHAQSNGTPDASPDPLEAVWDRVFMRKGNKISLHVLPSTKTASSDALLMLIYGYQKWLGQESVRSVDLMEAGQQSGLRIDRIDRYLTPEHRKLIIKGGMGKGSRYSLNNRGLKIAQEMLEKLFD
jgi:hypothetical protein